MGPVTKPAILVVGNFLSTTTRVRSICEDLAENLSRAGWQVLTTSRYPGRIPRVLDMLKTVWRERENYQLAHVEVYSGLAFIWAELVCETLKIIGKPAILTLHSGELPEFASRWSGRVRRLLNAADVVTAPSSFLLEKMKPYRNDIRLIPNPINLSAYSFKQRTMLEPRLIWLRAFHKTYNPSLAPKLIPILNRSHPDTNLVMIGPDKRDGSLQMTQQVAEQLNVQDQLHFPGAIPKAEVPFRLSQAEIFVNTTNIDNAPISVIEAMACGLCIVSTNVGGIPYLLKNEVDSLLVEPNSPEAMAGAIKRLLDNPQLATRLSKNARKKAESLCWSSILPQWEKVLIDMTEGNSDE